MKNLTAICLSAFIWLGITSCTKTVDKINQATEFDISYTTNLTIPTSTIVPNTPVDITTPEIPSQSSSKFATEKTSQGLIDEIKLTKFDISTSGANLNFLKSLSIYLKTSGGDVLVAKKDSIPPGLTAVSADLQDVNIKETVFKDKIQFKISASFNSTPGSSQSTLKLDQVVHVKGKRVG